MKCPVIIKSFWTFLRAPVLDTHCGHVLFWKTWYLRQFSQGHVQYICWVLLTKWTVSQNVTGFTRIYLPYTTWSLENILEKTGAFPSLTVCWRGWVGASRVQNSTAAPGTETRLTFLFLRPEQLLCCRFLTNRYICSNICLRPKNKFAIIKF